MEVKANLSAKKVLEKKFTANVKGYDPREVDAFLDQVIQDYVSLNAAINELRESVASLQGKAAPAEKTIRDLSDENAKLKEKIDTLEVAVASLNGQLKGIKPGDRMNAENMEYIKRINALEMFLFKEGYDVKDLKSKNNPT